MRSFPSKGLSLSQISYYLRSKGLETETINVVNALKEYMDDGRKDGEEEVGRFILSLIKAYIREGIPIIAGLAMSDKGAGRGLHAVVISGYCEDEKGDNVELYVHDDDVGPYASVLSKNKFLRWEYRGHEWGLWDIDLEYLLVPLYHKIRLSFGEIYDLKEDFYHDMGKKIDILFYSVNSYKNYLIKEKFQEKEQHLIMPMPGFLWVLRIFDDGNPTHDIVYDATAPSPDILCEITYT